MQSKFVTAYQLEKPTHQPDRERSVNLKINLLYTANGLEVNFF
jgi:hypothetical protein